MHLESPSGRLQLVLQPTSEEVFEPDSVSDAPLIRFIAYGTHQRVFGWVRLRADRLSDMLNAHEELFLVDVELETLADGMTGTVDEILIHRADLIAVQASGPRGDVTLRQTTRTHPIAIQAGNYLIGGYLHVVAGAEPLASAWDRPPMIPLTDAWIEYWADGERQHQSIGTIVVNRDATDWIRVVSEKDLVDGQLRPSITPTTSPGVSRAARSGREPGPEVGSAPSARSPLQTRSDHPGS